MLESNTDMCDNCIHLLQILQTIRRPPSGIQFSKSVAVANNRYCHHVQRISITVDTNCKLPDMCRSYDLCGARKAEFCSVIP